MRYIFALLFLLSSLCGMAQTKWNARSQSYIDQYHDVAIAEMLKYKIPASITLAQGLLESGAGESELARKGNNHFGIKCHGWQGRKTYHDDDESQECFRAYNSVMESYEDHSRFLVNSSRYRRLFSLKTTDYKGWAHGLKACGYATNPAYAQRLIGIIETYGLHKYDKAKSYDEFVVNTQRRQGGEGARLHPIHIYNKNYYLNARKGDTFRSIGEEVGISYRKIARYNERHRNDPLQPGEIVYLKKKRSKADKAFKNRPHVVRQGESMYDIAQRYGIRLKSLYKMNSLPADYMPKVGDRLRVR